MVVRWSRAYSGRSQLGRMKRWKACNRQSEICGGRIDRLKLRANEIDRLKFSGANFFRFGDAQLDRLKRWKACNRQIETCGRRIGRLKLRATKIGRLKLLGANFRFGDDSELGRLKVLEGLQKADPSERTVRGL